MYDPGVPPWDWQGWVVLQWLSQKWSTTCLWEKVLGHPFDSMSLLQEAADTAGDSGLACFAELNTTGNKNQAKGCSLQTGSAEGQVFQQHDHTPTAVNPDKYKTWDYVCLMYGFPVHARCYFKEWVQIRARKLIWQIKASTCQSCGSVFPMAVTHPTREASITKNFPVPSRAGWLKSNSCSAGHSVPWHDF